MLETYLQLLDTLKEKQFSRMLRLARYLMVETLTSEKFSMELQSYFTSIREEGVPFIDFSGEPQQVSQVKKLINALYHGELALRDAETINLRNGSRKTKDVVLLYQSTIHHIYQAGYLSTHLDIDFTEVFGTELGLLSSIYHLVQPFVATYSEETKSYMLSIDHQDLPRKLGVVGGIVVDQLGFSGGEIDYEFLTRFGAIIPEYLDKLSGSIAKFSSNVASYEPNIDKQKLVELQEDALKLLNALEGIRNSWFLPIRTLHYIHVIRYLITLSWSIFDQVGHLDETSQEGIFAKLAQVKNELLPSVLGFIDKIEAEVALAPGIMSHPVMDSVVHYYGQLIQFLWKFVDFSNHKTLTCLEDATFITARFQHTFKRIAEDQKNALLNERIQTAADRFFSKLRSVIDHSTPLALLPEPLKTELIGDYKVIRPFVLQYDIPLNNTMVLGLTTQASPGTFSRISGAHYVGTVRQILLMQPTFDQRLAKVRVSQNFIIKLRHNIIDKGLDGILDLKLFPHILPDNPYVIDEAAVLGVTRGGEGSLLLFDAVGLHQRLRDDQPLTSQQAVMLYQFYQVTIATHDRAVNAFQEYCRVLREYDGSESFTAVTIPLRTLYAIFQRYLVGGLATHTEGVTKFLQNSSLIAMDKEVVELLSKGIAGQDDLNQLQDVIAPFKRKLTSQFRTSARQLRQRAKQVSLWLQEIFTGEERTIQLLPELHQVDRAYHVIRHRAFSEAVADARVQLLELMYFFSDAVRRQVSFSASGLPFPALEEVALKLMESGQALAIKRLYNALYYFECVSVYLEALHEASTESIYAYNIVRIGAHLRKAMLLIKELATAPYLSVIAGGVRQKLEQGYQLIQELKSHYSPEAVGDEVESEPMGHQAIFYALNALVILPEHIAALEENRHLSTEKIEFLQESTKKLARDIERILLNSNSPFKLFFEISTMYCLFREIKAKLFELALASHDLVYENLQSLKDKLLTDILLAADAREDSLCLRPGTVTTNLKDILDTFYQGLLEPLGLVSQRQAELIASTVQMERRIEAARFRARQAIYEKRKTEKKQQDLQQFLNRITFYCSLKGEDVREQPAAKVMMISAFKAVLPLLKAELQDLSLLIAAEDPKALSLDTLFNEVTPHAPQLRNIEAWAKLGYKFYQGLVATHETSYETAMEKLLFIRALEEKQSSVTEQFIDKLTQASFDKQVVMLAAKHVGLIHSSGEYNRKLTSYLLEARAFIVGEAKKSNDIERAIEQQICSKIEEFEVDHYLRFYHLERVMAAIERLKNYVHQSNKAIQNKSSVFESTKTLQNKSSLVAALEALAQNETEPITVRLKNLEAFVKDPKYKFEKRLLKDHCPDALSYAWLKYWLAAFSEWVGVYTSERRAIHNEFVHAVKTPEENMSQLSALFGLFSHQTRSYPLPREDTILPEPGLA